MGRPKTPGCDKHPSRCPHSVSLLSRSPRPLVRLSQRETARPASGLNGVAHVRLERAPGHGGSNDPLSFCVRRHSDGWPREKARVR